MFFYDLPISTSLSDWLLIILALGALSPSIFGPTEFPPFLKAVATNRETLNVVNSDEPVEDDVPVVCGVTDGLAPAGFARLDMLICSALIVLSGIFLEAQLYILAGCSVKWPLRLRY